MIVVQGLAGLAGLGSLVCLVLVLLKMFPAEGPLKGILAIICGIYAFVWGWMNKDQYGLTKVMQIWTVLIILAVICNIGVTVMAKH